MGMLVVGKWIQGSIIKSEKNGAYDRLPRTFRDFISNKHSKFKPESGRYHLYVSYACPWAHRTLIYRKLKNLENHISISVVHPDMLENGWIFDANFEGATKDHLFGFELLSQVYQKADPKVTTSVTVPILWDKKENTIVNNESSEIIRMFNESFNELTQNFDDFYPPDKRPLIDKLNQSIYSDINNGVYKTGFAKTQKSYNDAVDKLFIKLGEIDKILDSSKYLTGDTITEADLRLIPTLLRFDMVYFTHFKCNIKLIRDFKNLSAYVKNLYSLQAINQTTNFEHIKRHYYYSHEDINPNRIIPKGPVEIF